MKNYMLLLFSTFLFAQNTQIKLQKVFDENKLMGLTVITFSGKTQKEYNFGLRNFTTNLPIEKNTKFRVASISKAFTTLGLMKLFDQKKFKLDDDISNYLGYKVINPKFPETPITFRMLMSHTSSLADGAGYDVFLGATYNEKEIPNIKSILLTEGKYFTTDIFLDKKPGTYFTYCNLNYGLIGTLIEKISNQRFDVYMKNEILKPLKINSSYNLQDISDLENVAALYRKVEGKWSATKDDYPNGRPTPTNLSAYVPGTNGVFYGPQGGLRVTSTDLVKFLKFIKSDGKTSPKIVTAKTIQSMKKIQWNFDGLNGDNYNGMFNRWGLGLHHTNTIDKDLVWDIKKYGSFIGHAGDAYGLISDAFYSEKKDFGFILITNGIFDGFQPGKTTAFFSFEEEIFKAIFEK